ncbi:MAG: hypothetical protein AMXMBFR13_05560 [Phycisphaerae bacterium]
MITRFAWPREKPRATHVITYGDPFVKTVQRTESFGVDLTHVRAERVPLLCEQCRSTKDVPWCSGTADTAVAHAGKYC